MSRITGPRLSSDKDHIRSSSSSLPYGDGSGKIFGMENFGNTCYCNSILQCLFYSEKFRHNILAHNRTHHDPKLNQNGVKSHNFTTKYEQLVSKRLKEANATNNVTNQIQNGGATTNGNDVLNGNGVNDMAGMNNIDRPKSSRKGSIFGIKFSNSNNNNSNGNTSNNHLTSLSSQSDGNNQNKFIYDAKDCPALSIQQRISIQRNRDFENLQIMVTRPSLSSSNSTNRNDHSQSSSFLLSNDSKNNPHNQDNASPDTTNNNNEPRITPQSHFVVVGIPQPETFLSNPINPFNPSPSTDQRKRSALINGPIINLDHPLQLPSEQSDETALLYALKDLFECMVENKSQIGVVSPSYFITRLKEKNFLFRQNNMHHDAHEFCNYLINEIIESLNFELSESNPFNWCTDLFQGLITNETKCLSCETITSKEETFLDLSIDIPPGDSSYSLSHSLNNFSKLETLTHQNKFYCNTCSSLQEATKTIKLKKLPEVMIINFKRFKYDENADKMVKLFDSISYPLKLRLFNTSESDDNNTNDENNNDNFTLYELYALVVHIGGGPMHGHYVSLCKCKAGLWLLFDDETVEIVDECYVMRFFGNGPGLASSYILFYQKCDTLNPELSVDFGLNLNEIYNGSDYSLVEKANLTSKPEPISTRKTSSAHSYKFSKDLEPEENHSVHHKNSDCSAYDPNFTYPTPTNPFNTTPSLESSFENSIATSNQGSGSNILPNNNSNSSSGTGGLTRKASLFKKNFKLENTNTTPSKEKEKESVFHLPRSLSRSSSMKGPLSQHQHQHHPSDQSMESELSAQTPVSPIPETTQTEPPKHEKKTWVGGLKRRESRLGSFSSTTSNTSSTSNGNSSSLNAKTSSTNVKPNKSNSLEPPKETGKRRSIFGFKKKSDK